MLRGAIIGLGNVAVEGHLPGWAGRDEVQIVAVTDLQRAREADVAARLPAARWYASAEALLADAQLDFVDICTPPSSHARLIERALGRGLHALCEKPLVRSIAELTSVTRLAVATGRVLHTVHNWHHAPIIKRTAELVRQGAIGQVTRVVWQTLRTSPAPVRDGQGTNWRLDPDVAGGGILSDHGWHVFYVLQRWLGERPTSVSARLERRRNAGWPVEDTATVHVAFSNAAADISLTWAADTRRNWARLTGTGGTIELHDDTCVLTQGGREQRWLCPPALSNGSVHPDWFEPVAGRFLAEVTGAAPRGANLAEASLCVMLESLARESSRRGGETLAVSMPVSGAATRSEPSV
ncbi:MAG: Gfo/Idh/MocA family oxidoreductase [Candidatus Rokubacteria bacterium]|nr:Gfo/Idh/MocA family oxidoreductase [Candidatus Rokubacteria bacterium]